MNSQEEYFLRHNIDAPLVKVCDKANLIFRANRRVWKSPWVIFNIKKVQRVNYHPAHFNFSLMHPLHNGSDSPNFCKSIFLKEVGFEEYELEIMSQCDVMKELDPISDLSEAKLAAWEMFLYCNDYRLNSIPARLKDSLFISIDSDYDIESRMINMEKVVNGLQKTSHLASRWEIIKQYSDPICYATWYAKIINDVRGNYSYRQNFSDIKAIA